MKLPVSSYQWTALATLFVAGLMASGCGAASAAPKTNPADVPAMTVPPPPPRTIEPAPPPEPGPEPVGDLPTTPPSPVRTPKREPPKPSPAEPKAEPKPETPPPAEAAPAPPPTQAPVPQLSTPQTADSSEAARTVRATIDRARGALATVNYQDLSNERKKAYNDVKMFLEQAEGAVKQGNYTFAQGIATKAETLARELGGK